MTFEIGKPLPYFCPACEAVPVAGYCRLAGCPTSPAESPPIGSERSDEGNPATADPIFSSLQPPVVAGWREMPEEPTEEMQAVLAALGNAMVPDPHERSQWCWFAVKAYRAMRTVAPLPPLLVGGEEAKADDPNPDLEAVNGRLP